MKYVFIVNPVSGHKDKEAIFNRIRSAFRLLDDDFFSALRTRDAGLLKIRLRIPALRESRTCEELTVRTVLDDHPSSADLTDLIRFLICDVDRLKRSLGLIHRCHEIRVEVSDDRLPRGQSLSDAV